MQLTNLNTIKSLLQAHNLWAKKHFGQNFLISESALEIIVNTADISKNDHIIEIGPGLGVLTQQLAQKAKNVTTIELDETLLPILKETLQNYENIKIVNDDALEFTPPSSKYKVVANIPYNITSPLLNHFLQAQTTPQSMTLLVQKEVAEKMCKPTSQNQKNKSPKHSILSLQVHLFGEPKLIKKVPSTAFHPAPKVDSAIIHIEVYKKSHKNYIPKNDALSILKLAKQAFTQKRKKLSNTLGKLKLPGINLSEKLKKLGLENARPEHLRIEDWKKLIN